MSNRLLTAEDVAEQLRLRVDHVYKLAREDRIPHLRFGRSLRFRTEAVNRWLEEEERGNGGEQAHRRAAPTQAFRRLNAKSPI